MSTPKEYTNKDLDKPEVQAELEKEARERREAKTRELIGQHLSKDVVARMRLVSALKIGAGLKPSQLVGVLKVAPDGKAFWSVESRMGFPYQEIGDRDLRRVIWEALEQQDDEEWLRIVIVDQQHTFGASIRVTLASRGEA